MKKFTLNIAFLALLALQNVTAFSGEQHTFFNPTPAVNMRAMTTERPSKTDSPYSIDAGHFQLETNLLGYSDSKDCQQSICNKTKQYEVGSFSNLRIGLTDQSDLQVVTDVYLNRSDSISNSAIHERNQGFGDTQLRFKYNIFGNNPSDKYSLGLLPYVKFSTHRENLGNKKIEYGIGFPFNINLTDEWSIGGMSVLSAINDEQHLGYDFAYANALVIGKTINAKWRAYLEYYTFKAKQPEESPKNTVDLGVIYSVNANFSVDLNVQKGVTDAADDIKFLFGTAYRF